jgi:hypothetical protein
VQLTTATLSARCISRAIALLQCSDKAVAADRESTARRARKRATYSPSQELLSPLAAAVVAAFLLYRPI